MVTFSDGESAFKYIQYQFGGTVWELTVLVELPDSVENIHREGASLHCQNPTSVFAGIIGLVQVEELLEFLHPDRRADRTG